MGTIRDFEHEGWQAAASTYQDFAGATQLFVEPLLQAAGAAPGVRLLDLACGPGIVAGEAAARGARVTGVDFSAAMIALARERHPAVEFHTADAEDLPFAEACFDAVAANFGIHHVERPERAIGEARRVLAPGGTFAFTFWGQPQHNTTWRIILDAVAACGRKDVPMPAGDSTHATPENFTRLVVAAGFDDRTLRCELIERAWHLPSDADLVSIFETGTVRMGMLLRGQGELLPAVRRGVAEALQSYRREQAIALPIGAWLLVAKAA